MSQRNGSSQYDVIRGSTIAGHAKFNVRFRNHSNDIRLCRKEMVLLNMTSLEGRRSQVMLNLMFVSGTIATTEDYDVKEMVPLRS